MSNNLKAERTLTAFDAWFNEQEGYSLRSERFEGDVEWLKAAFEAGALSTQQPMGEPVAMIVRIDGEDEIMWLEGSLEVGAGDYLYALHPNQDSGE